ncbi:MAG TPA: histidine kinase, partial [Bacteroidota bacterium]|nr:histidine kinase [Bacteroidota bacterium]
MTHARWRTHTLTFWHYQCAGWGFVAVAQCMRVYFVHGWRGDLELSIALQVAAAFLFTSLLRLWYRTIRYQTFPLAAIVGLIAAGSSAVSVVWWGAFLLLQHSLFGAEALNDALIPLNIITVFAYTFPKHLIWSTLYFGIKVWQDWIEEREHAARAAAEAQRAQFHMLRYKLNPEFFFSTLRRIHQLMETDAASAKAMVTSLAECLRYSLVTKNGGSVPLSIELDAVRQYLSLEQELG